MTTVQRFHVTVAPRDPVIARDGRPFSLGLRMRGLDWLYPSVTTGALRTLVGEFAGGFSDRQIYDKLTGRLKAMAVKGPLLCTRRDGIDTALCVPAPLDITVQKLDSGQFRSFAIRPSDAGSLGGGCDVLSGYGLFPAVREGADEDFKPTPVPPFWTMDRIAEWLVGDAKSVKEFPDWPNGHFEQIERDTRVHVELDEQTGASKKGMLFTTAGLDLTRLTGSGQNGSSDAGIALQVETADADFAAMLKQLAAWSPLGGERRLAHWVGSDASSLWAAPSSVRDALAAKPTFVRMVLATPALFEHGWRPAWLRLENRRLIGTVPDTKLEVRLVGAVVDRWRPVSGWSYEPPVGPKATRRMVPAGSVYFFRVESGVADELSSRWLAPVSDNPQDKRDGFGLAMWGTWTPFRPEDIFEASLQ